MNADLASSSRSRSHLDPVTCAGSLLLTSFSLPQLIHPLTWLFHRCCYTVSPLHKGSGIPEGFLPLLELGQHSPGEAAKLWILLPPIVSLQPLSRRIAVLGYDEVNDAFVRLFPCEREDADGDHLPSFLPHHFCACFVRHSG